MTLLGRVYRPLRSRQVYSNHLRNLFSTSAIANPENNVQVYRLTSRDPFINLSIEHYLLQHSPPESVVLILYTNSPSIVIGRNQNPWLEVNLSRLAELRESSADEAVQLVRRRSGGGTVFHDEGNINFSVICPPKAFDRNKHAEMVVRALHRLGKTTTRVNERHDIVMDVQPENGVGTFKISGSAYKLTRTRSLHHGTCLLQSPNLKNISSMLRSPAEPFIKARGVDSVRSPVRNVGLTIPAFEDAARQEFQLMYGQPQISEDVGEDALEIEKVQKGCEELRSRDWIYGQTPRFSFSTYPTEEDPRKRPELCIEVCFNTDKGRKFIY